MIIPTKKVCHSSSPASCCTTLCTSAFRATFFMSFRAVLANAHAAAREKASRLRLLTNWLCLSSMCLQCLLHRPKVPEHVQEWALAAKQSDPRAFEARCDATRRKELRVLHRIPPRLDRCGQEGLFPTSPIQRSHREPQCPCSIKASHKDVDKTRGKRKRRA